MNFSMRPPSDRFMWRLALIPAAESDRTGRARWGVAGPGVIDDYSGQDGEMFEMFEPADAQETAEITRIIVERTLREVHHDIPFICAAQGIIFRTSTDQKSKITRRNFWMAAM